MFTPDSAEILNPLFYKEFQSWPNFCYVGITLLKNYCCVFQNGKTLFLRFSPGYPGFFFASKTAPLRAPASAPSGLLIGPGEPRQQRLYIGGIHSGTAPDSNAWRRVAVGAYVIGDTFFLQ